LAFEFPVGDQSTVGPRDSRRNIDGDPFRPAFDDPLKKLMEKRRILVRLACAIRSGFRD
jgi:hypothetical protein